MRATVLVMVGVMVGVAGVSTPVAAAEPPGAVPVVRPVVLAEIPQSAPAFTEGIELDGGSLYEATGEVGKSELRQVDPATGTVLRATPLPNNYFGEGFVVLGDRILQLTYDGRVILEWDKASLTLRRQIPFPNAWGICQVGDQFVVSDGSPELALYDMNLVKTGSVAVTRDGEPVYGLDELDCTGDQVWAALWPGDEVARVNLDSGQVNLVADMSGLWKWGQRSNRQVFSSLARISGDQFYVVGKEWPSIFKVRIDGA